MSEAGRKNNNSIHCRHLGLPVVPVLLPALPVFKAGTSGISATFFPAASELPAAYLLILALATGIVVALYLFFSSKLKELRNSLDKKESEIFNLNSDLLALRYEISRRKEEKSRESSESEKFYRMLVQSADDGISFYDRDLNLKFANAAFYSLIGYDQKEYNSTDPESLIHPDDRDYMAKRTEALKNQGFYQGELRLKHKNGNYVILSTRSVSVKNDDGDIIGSLTVSRDITSLKHAQSELEKANAEAETSNRLKSSFLANISHEIRTPLNAVVGFSNLLLSNDITNEAKEEYIEHINHNSERLLQIIGDIIDLSRLESSQIEITYEEASVNEIVNEIADETRRLIKRNEKSIILNVRSLLGDEVDLIFTDRVWLKRVLNHLMDNAVKFTLEGSIELSYERRGDELLFKVRDTGIGISEENLEYIFEGFRQEIGGHQRPFEGLGIGLTLAKEVVERMGGKIYVQSQKGIGSEFSFSIPYRPAGGTSRIKSNTFNPDQASVPVNWSNKKCLLVDDNKDILTYLNRVLLDTGITILTARSGFEALDIIKKNSDIDLVLLDMQMPEMNGIEVTREIRKIHKDLPIIAQTAFIFEDDKDIILEAGCDACLIKPIRKDHLLTVMSGFIRPA